MLQGLFKGIKTPRGITHIAGPPNSGKTTLLYNVCRSIKKNEKAIIFDCEMNFSAQRLKEIIIDNEINLQNIIIIRTPEKNSQFLNIMKLHNFLAQIKCSFIAINGMTNHFRIPDKEDNMMLPHKMLAMQMAYLNLISKKLRTPILLTNQVLYRTINKRKKFIPVLNTIIEHYSDNAIMVELLNKGIWRAKSKNNEVLYKLVSTGIEIV